LMGNTTVNILVQSRMLSKTSKRGLTDAETSSTSKTDC
jgi:hypothetical protein